MKSKEYLIGELAEEADTTVRTIRYYVTEGLLPPPTTSGKYAHFSQAHLDRLELIRRLKALHLPLEEIRQILQVAGAEDIHRMLEYQERINPKLLSPMPEAGTDQPGKAALDYLSRLTRARSTIREPGHLFAAKSPHQAEKATQDTHRDAVSPPETWERIRLAPGVELNYRATQDAHTQAQINRLIQFAQGLFQNKKGDTDDR